MRTGRPERSRGPTRHEPAQGQQAGEELAAAARAGHAITHARAADPDEQPRLHRRPDHTTAGTDITATWLDHAQAELDDALRRLGEARRTAA